MRSCPLCGYYFEAFESVCPRCSGRGIPTNVEIPPAENSAKKTSIESTPETIGATLRGGLLALLPPFFITTSFAFDWASNSINRDKHSVDLSLTTLVSMVLFVPLCVLEGAGIGAWVGSGLPKQEVRKGVTVGTLGALGLCALITMLGLIHFDAGLWGLIPLVFIGVVLCGAYGGAERHRNGHGENDDQLFLLLGIGILSACMPCIGFLLIMALGRNGSDKAPAALWGTSLGFTGFGLMVLMTLFTPR